MDIEALMQIGYEAIETFDHDLALQVGEQLLQHRHSSGFEILALAYRGLEKPEKAIRILQQGVRKAPEAWLLWQLLGNLYSDDGRYIEAHMAYRSALKCPGADRASILLNRAILYTREERYTKALKALGEVTEGEPALHADLVRLGIFNDQERYEEALALARRLIEREGEFESADERARIYAEQGKAHWKGFHNGRAALDRAWKAITLDRHQPTAAWLIRDVENLRSPKSNYYRILIEGIWPEPQEGKTKPPGFFTSYDVVAPSPEEAIELIRRFEPEGVRPTLKLRRCKALEKRPDDPIGVYRMTGYAFFPRKPKKK